MKVKRTGLGDFIFVNGRDEDIQYEGKDFKYWDLASAMVRPSENFLNVYYVSKGSTIPVPLYYVLSDRHKAYKKYLKKLLESIGCTAEQLLKQVEKSRRVA